MWNLREAQGKDQSDIPENDDVNMGGETTQLAVELLALETTDITHRLCVSPCVELPEMVRTLRAGKAHIEKIIRNWGVYAANEESRGATKSDIEAAARRMKVTLVKLSQGIQLAARGVDEADVLRAIAVLLAWYECQLAEKRVPSGTQKAIGSIDDLIARGDGHGDRVINFVGGQGAEGASLRDILDMSGKSHTH